MSDAKGSVVASDEVSDSRWLGKGPVWIMILIVGPLALPFLFRSPHFSRGAKWAISVPLLLLTVLFLAAILFLILNDITMEMVLQMAESLETTP